MIEKVLCDIIKISITNLRSQINQQKETRNDHFYVTYSIQKIGFLLRLSQTLKNKILSHKKRALFFFGGFVKLAKLWQCFGTQ